MRSFMSNVNFEDFVGKFAEALNIKSEKFFTKELCDLPQYDSMGKIYTSILIEELYGFQIEYEQLDKAETIKSLYEFCQTKVSE